MNVLDSTAMLALLLKEDGGDVVRNALLDKTRPCVAHGLNMCEVYYHFLRTDDVATADAAIQTLLDAGLRVQEMMDEAFWKDVGFLKATYPPISLGERFVWQPHAASTPTFSPAITTNSTKLPRSVSCLSSLFADRLQKIPSSYGRGGLGWGLELSSLA